MLKYEVEGGHDLF